MVKPEKGRVRNSAKILYPEGGPGVPQRNNSTESIRYNGMSFTGDRICFTLLHILWGKYIRFFNKTNKWRPFFIIFFTEAFV